MKIFSRPTRRDSISIESIVQLILREWSKDDLDFVRSGDHDFGMLGRSIRNDYGLWEFDHPLTQHWHMNPECRTIIDGIDYSEDHPDHVSAVILECLRKKL